MHSHAVRTFESKLPLTQTHSHTRTPLLACSHYYYYLILLLLFNIIYYHYYYMMIIYVLLWQTVENNILLFFHLGGMSRSSTRTMDSQHSAHKRWFCSLPQPSDARVYDHHISDPYIRSYVFTFLFTCTPALLFCMHMRWFCMYDHHISDPYYSLVCVYFLILLSS